MATQYSNKPIVLDGLVYALDFGNQKSYVSGSSVARSLIFGNLSASINAGFDGRAITFTGSQTAVTNFAPVNLTNYESGSWTAMATIKLDSTGYFMPLRIGNGRFVTRISNQSLELNYNLEKYNYPKQYEVARLYNPTAFRNGSYANLTLRGSSGSLNLFVNGIPVSPTSAPVLEIAAVNGDLSLNGNAPFSSAPWSGSLATFHFYNRALTADEIYYNYQLVAPRYSLPTISKPYTVDEDVFLFVSRSGIVDPTITSSLDTFVRGLKSASLWDKMFAIYPFVGTGSAGVNLTGSQRWNLKEPGIYSLIYSGAWSGSVSGSTPSGSNTFIQAGGINPSNVYSNMSNTNTHISILSYDTPVSRSYLMGTGMTEDLATSTLAGDYGTPAAAYSVRKVRTAYTGALMDVRRSIDNVTSSIGFVSNGDLDTGSLVNFVKAVGENSPGNFSGLAAAYSLRRVSASYSGPAIDVRRDSDNITGSIGFDASGNLDTGSLLTFLSSSTVLPGNYSGLTAAYSLRRIVPTYTGSAIMVRSGSVSQSIGFDSFGNLNTASIASFAGSGDAFVSIWYDQSGNNNHATQSITANQPQIYSGSLGSVTTENGKPALVFDGVNDELLILNRPLNGTGSFTILGVSRKTDIIAGGNVFTGGGSDSTTAFYAHHYYFAPQSPSYKFISAWGSANGASFSSQSIDTGSAYLSFSSYTPGLHQYWLNSIAGTTSGKNDSNLASGSWGIGSAGTLVTNNYLKGNIQELLFYNVDQSSNRKPIENNINTYYNVYARPSGYVTRWYDQSGNNRHATQTATGSQPLIVSSGSLVTENGKSAVRFDGVDDFLKTVSTIDFNNQSIVSQFLVGKNPNPSTGIITGLGQYQLDIQNDKVQIDNGNITLGNYNTSSYYNISVFRNSGNTQLFFNNILNATSSAVLSNIGNVDFTIGNRNDLASYSNGSVQEALIYTSSQAANRPLIENNINNYYNIYTGSNHGFVARWYDQSGNNRHATQTATGSQPLIVLSGSILNINSRPSLKFDGVNDSLVSSYRPTTNIIAVESVQKINSASGVSVLINETNGPLYLQWVNTPSTFANYYGGITNTTFSSNQLLQSFYMQSGGGGFFQNGISTVSNAQGGSGASSLDLRIGGFDGSSLFSDSNHQELVIYQTAQLSNREPIQYGINSYYNIYPQTSSFATSSFTISAASGSVSASLNNRLTSGISTSGPLGLITVSRTGSNSLTIARNGVTSSFAVPASGALSTGIYLGAINNNSIALGNSPLNISFASVGTGLTNSETQILNRQVQLLKYNLQNPSIVTNGLVLNLDALIPSSYPGTGNTWFDLSGNNNNGTLTNGPVFTNDNGGTIVFDGTNDYISFQNLTTSNLGLNTSSGASLGCWLKLNLLSRYTGVFAFWSSGDQCDFGWDLTPANNIRLWKQSQTGLGITPYNNQWAYYVLTSSPTGVVFYINGVVSATWNNTNNVPFTSNRYLTFGDHWDSPIQGNSSQIQIYNRALTDAEVLQNFNATRGRFGV